MGCPFGGNGRSQGGLSPKADRAIRRLEVVLGCYSLAAPNSRSRAASSLDSLGWAPGSRGGLRTVDAQGPRGSQCNVGRWWNARRRSVGRPLASIPRIEASSGRYRAWGPAKRGPSECLGEAWWAVFARRGGGHAPWRWSGEAGPAPRVSFAVSHPPALVPSSPSSWGGGAPTGYRVSPAARDPRTPSPPGPRGSPLAPPRPRAGTGRLHSRIPSLRARRPAPSPGNGLRFPRPDPHEMSSTFS